MKTRVLLILALVAAVGLSACSNEARYRRYVRSSIRDKEKRQKQIRKDIERQNRKILEETHDAEPPPASVTIQ